MNPRKDRILLDAYAARSCPVKTHNAFDPTVAIPVVEAGGRLTELFDGASEFEAVVLEQLITQCRGRVVDLRLLAAEPPAERTQACVTAMASGAAVIIAGLLPVDGPGHRVGRPDLLVRGADSPTGTPAYHPAVVKWHKIIERARPRAEDLSGVDGGRPPSSGHAEPAAVCYSTLADPAPAAAQVLPGHSLRLGSRAADFLQLAHYHRMLQACGFAATPARGAVIGTDGLWPTPVLAWADLDRPSVRTFSRSHPDGWRLRSLLERYDFEQAFRVAIAEVARRQTGDPEIDPPPLVRPIVNRECGRCHWWEHCRPQLDPDDVSLRIDKGALDSREIVTLRRHGIATITDLAGVDLDELLTWYLPEVTHRSGAEMRIRTAARRARMLLDGRWFDRETSGPIEVPAADVEIDFDIETAADGRVYLWGFLVQPAGGPGVYHEFSRFADLDDDGRGGAGPGGVRLAAQRGRGRRTGGGLPLQRLRGGQDPGAGRPRGRPAAGLGGRVRRGAVRRPAGDRQDPLLRGGRARAEADGPARRVLAGGTTIPAGSTPRSGSPRRCTPRPEPARAAARQRVLDYNEDDVLATAQLRAWLRAQ